MYNVHCTWLQYFEAPLFCGKIARSIGAVTVMMDDMQFYCNVRRQFCYGCVYATIYAYIIPMYSNFFLRK
jgi:hypothetical protein